MGNNQPKESNMGNHLRCYKCNMVLPPCNDFSDLKQDYIYGRNVHVFNGGEYFRLVGYNELYECRDCFYKPIREEERLKQEQKKKEKKKREEEEEQKRRDQQRAREAEERKRREELNQRLEESRKQAQEQLEEQVSRIVSEKHQFQVSAYLSEFQSNYKSDEESELLKTLSSKCTVATLNLTQLNKNQLGNTLLALEKLLFDEWMSAPPSLSTLQHTQVFIAELYVLSNEKPERFSLESTSNHVQSLVESISQSACNVSENFLLTQALFLNLMHVFTGPYSSGTDPVLIAKRWADVDLSSEDLFLIEFLGVLISSLANVIKDTSVFILRMEIQCLILLLDILTNLNSTKSHSEATEMVLRLVQTNQWTPAEAMTLLKALSEKCSGDTPLTEILKMVYEYDISPEWTDDSGNSLIQVLDVLDPKTFQTDLQSTLQKTDDTELNSALAELKEARNLDDATIDKIRTIISSVQKYLKNKTKQRSFLKKIKRITTSALHHLETNPNQESFSKGPLKNIEKSLRKLCKAVFKTKGWWPTVQQMMRWCMLVLTETSGDLKLVMEEDPCVTAMFAATQVFLRNKVDLVLSSELLSLEKTKNWSDFYQHLGISFSTNINKFSASERNDVYEADIVYGTMDDFMSDYLQYGLEVMETGKPHLSRGFIVETRSLSSSHTLEFKRLKESNALSFAADILQSLMGNLNNENMELRQDFIKAFLVVLHTHLKEDTNTGNKIISILLKLNERKLSSSEIYFLTILEDLTRVFTEDTAKSNSAPEGKWCLNSLCFSAKKFAKQTKDVFQMVSNLAAQRLWSPKESLILLEALSDHHYNEECISILKILHFIETYQVTSLWMDERNQSLLQLLKTFETAKLIQHLENSFKNEKDKSIDCLFEEIRHTKNIDEETLGKSYSVVKAVNDMIKSGEITHHNDFQRARKLSQSTAKEDLQEILAVLCNAVHVCAAEKKWWPRVTQMTSWSLLALSKTGKLLEMSTGEGKSCVIAMFAVLRALRGEKVDVILELFCVM